ncbi:MAG TPA: hypothetical protein VER04_27985, partial [Polyangiaceae bacterium]|nr:hypothetical protein [Polyangiaceae bacterium]
MNDPNPQKSRLSSSPPTAARLVRLRPWHCALLALFGSALGFTSQAQAQVDADVSVQMPNVLLLVDTSGSMEYKTSGNAFPSCKYDATGVVANFQGSSEKSRWIDLV